MSPETKNIDSEPSAALPAEAENSSPLASAAPEVADRAEAATAVESEASSSDSASAAQPPAAEPFAPDAQAADEASAAPEARETGETFDDQLIDKYAAPQPAQAQAEFVEGQVVAITELGVVVDLGAKTEGLIPAQEFADSPDAVPFLPGQTVEVQRLSERKEGYVLLSYQRARRRRVWELIEKSYREHTALTARVVGRIKGGLVVDIGVRAFLPASQVDLRPTQDLDALKDQELAVRVMKLNRKRGNVVVSRRVILDEELHAQRQRLMDSLSEGQVVAGRVKNITDYGVFMDLGGLDGLLHITDLSWCRLKHPSEAVQPGEELEVQILKFDREKMRVSLGRKQLLPDPWAAVPEKYPIGARAQGKVVGITDYGAFVELETGVEGLVHISEMTWSKRLKHPSKIVALGETIEVVVLDVQLGQRRISLGLKQATPDPWLALAEKYPVGTVIAGKVRNLTDFGAFVEIEEGFDGLIHVSDISWTAKVKTPAEVFKKGDTVEARVLKIDTVNRRVSLGAKQVHDIWAEWFAGHNINDVVRGKVTRLTTFGAFVELAAGIEGLCHISEIEERGKKGDKDRASRDGKPRSALEPGKEYDFKIIKVHPEQHKIGLSYRAAIKQVERQDMEHFRSSKTSPTATLGDVFYSKRNSV